MAVRFAETTADGESDNTEGIVTPEDRTAYIEARKQSVIGYGNQQAQYPVWVRDAQKYYPIWEVPLEALALNVDNKRFSAERDLVQRGLGRPLDPANRLEDEESIIAILCDSTLEVDIDRGIAVGTPSKDFKALSEDWAKRGQMEPLWIRPDGTVRNGNRRLAMLKRLRNSGIDVKEWIQAIILKPADVDEKELFRMEQREQLAENFKKRYQDVNALLALREAAENEDIDWDDPQSIQRVAGILKHFAGRDDAGYAAKQLYAIKAIDRYLAYVNASGQYSLAMRQVEVFREVGICMSTYQDDPDELAELLQAAFAFVQSGRNYGDIRRLRHLFGNNRSLFDDMAHRIFQIEEDSSWDPDGAGAAAEPPELSVATAPEDEDEVDGAEYDPEVSTGSTSYPRREVDSVIRGTLDRFTAVNLDIKEQIDQAASRLEAVNLVQLEGLRGSERDEAKATIALIAEWIRTAESLLV